MRQDQFEKLQALEEELLDVYLGEANSKTWPGAGIDVKEMTQQQRGDRYWTKRNAAATIALIIRTEGLIGRVQATGSGTTAPAQEGDDDESDLDREVASVEHEAARLMGKLQKRARGAS